MALADVARTYYAAQAALSDRTQRSARSVWSELDPAALSESWTAPRLGLRLFVAVAAAQLAAASTAVAYVAAALFEQGARSAPAGRLEPRALAGVASDGRDLESLLYEPLIRVKTAILDGHPPARAVEIGGSALDTIVGTQVADAGRAATDVVMVTEPAVTGWVRMLVPPSCGRCAVLAGRFYRWSDGFTRHPRCDCRHVPRVEDAADDLRTDPRAYFDSLSREDQDRYFTVSGAEAIRLGADIGQVVNARRGARGLSQPGRLTDAERRALRGGRERGRLERVDVYGRRVFATTEGTTRRGLAGQRLDRFVADAETVTRRGPEQRTMQRQRSRTLRLMPEGIAELSAGDRDEQVRLLRRFGYVV